jgi:hypothetical protein
MANKRIDDPSRSELTTLESGYKLLADSSTLGTKKVDLNKFVSTDKLVVLIETAYGELTPDADTFYFTYTA